MSASDLFAANSSSMNPSAPIKAVIWDLDETFWTGTLSEGAVQLVDRHVEVVRKLNDRGIVNSICSKNDASAVRATLDRIRGLWDEFVFPAISWEPKGPRISSVIEAMQLRAQNVLFIDDNPLNLKEALFYCPELQTAMPDIIESLLSLPTLRGKEDRARSRISHYRQLQQKWEARQAGNGSNIDFLRASDVRVAFSADLSADIHRIAELMGRANQLNYTKRRLDIDDVRALIGTPGVQALSVRVADNYGDYGLCGFIAYTDREVLDFVFSCRILHMGVENWVAQQLRLPAFTPTGEVATPLVADPVDWISNVSNLGPALPIADQSTSSALGGVLLKGGCDLSLVQNFLGGSMSTEFSRNSSTGALMHWHHTDFLDRKIRNAAKSRDLLIARLPFVESSLFDSSLQSPGIYETVVYGVVMDYTQGRYRYRDSDLIIPFEQYNRDLTDRTNWAGLVKQYGHQGLTYEFLNWYADEFAFLGGISTSEFTDRLKALLARHSKTRFIFLNAPEVPFDLDTETDRHLHHAQFNRALDRVVKAHDNATLCDLREIVKTNDDVTINLRHYPRRVYLQIARELAAEIDQVSFCRPSLFRRIRNRLSTGVTRLAGGVLPVNETTWF